VADLALTAEQRAVVTAPDGPLLVLAGPGTGDTAVLAARIAYLIAARGLGPASVLALTFSKCAALELWSCAAASRLLLRVPMVRVAR
jgi:DNA helicase II / ATP-dependent DNA helicase PcrA